MSFSTLDKGLLKKVGIILEISMDFGDWRPLKDPVLTEFSLLDSFLHKTLSSGILREVDLSISYRSS